MSLPPTESLAAQFSRHWELSTADSNLTLHGFRRFKTTHLLNLRFLEAEIAEIDHVFYQLGLGLDVPRSATDRLGLRHCQKDENTPSVDDTVKSELIQRLRTLLKEYDEALASFSTIMAMDTFSLLDDTTQAQLRTELTVHEKYKTRLLRIDQGPRMRQDPIQRYIHKVLRSFRYQKMAASQASCEDGDASRGATPKWPSQNTALLADVISRVIAAILMGVLLTVPLIALSGESRRTVQLGVVSVFIVLFACLVTVMFRASNLEMMVVSAAYAAILSVFVSNNSTS